MIMTCKTNTKAYIWFQDLKIGGGSSLNFLVLVDFDIIFFDKVLDNYFLLVAQK